MGTQVPSLGSLKSPSSRARGRKISSRAIAWVYCGTDTTYFVIVTVMSAVLFGKALSSSCQTTEKFAYFEKKERKKKSLLYTTHNSNYFLLTRQTWEIIYIARIFVSEQASTFVILCHLLIPLYNWANISEILTAQRPSVAHQGLTSGLVTLGLMTLPYYVLFHSVVSQQFGCIPPPTSPYIQSGLGSSKHSYGLTVQWREAWDRNWDSNETRK